MDKIEVMDYASEYNFARTWSKLNAVIRAINGLRCQEKEEPIYETLGHNEILIISKSEKGLLIVSNRYGEVKLERVKYTEDG